MSKYGEQLRELYRGRHFPDVSTMSDFRRVSRYWLGEVAAHVERLESALGNLVADWDSVDPLVQVPDEINVNEHWEEARLILGLPFPNEG